MIDDINKMQHYSPDGVDGGATIEPDNAAEPVAVKFDPKLFEQSDEFKSYISKLQTDAANKAALTREQKLKAEHEADVKAKEAEWERKSKLSAEEKERETREAFARDLAKKDADLKAREMKLSAIDYLDSIGLPKSLAEQVVAGTEEEMKQRADTLKKIIDEQAEAKKANALAGSVKAPKAGEPPAAVDPFLDGLLGKRA